MAALGKTPGGSCFRQVEQAPPSVLLTSSRQFLRGKPLPVPRRCRASVLAVPAGNGGVRSLRVQCAAAVLVKESYGVADAKGVSRPVMEDRHSVAVDSSGKGPSFFAVFDGHGGDAVAQLLTKELWPDYQKKLQAFPDDFEKATVKAYFDVDQLTLRPPKGLFGALMERGVGGSKCGSCANTAVLLPTPSGGLLLIAANVGDSRTVLSRDGKAVQLSFDHKPDVDEERFRIESKNPIPKQPLVRKAGGEWRVGGLLALSRAFGDVYLKDWDDGTRNGARGGFGLTAEPSVFLEEITDTDKWLILGTDGLWDHVSNQEGVDLCVAKGASMTPDQIAKELLSLAVSRGSTDDLTALVVKLPSS